MTKKYIYRINPDAANAPARIIRLVGENRKVLEVGCASGSQSEVMSKDLGCSVTGIEIDPVAAESARKYCETVITGNIEALDIGKELGDNRYDVVIFADVLEHLYDPGSVLEKIGGFLEDEGFVIASIPNIVHASIIYEMAKGRFDYRKYGLLDDTHIRFFTKKTICHLFEKAGYIIQSLDRVVVPAVETEFKTSPVNSRDEMFLEYIRDNNPEHDTYQFIVKARKAAGNVQMQSRSLTEAQETIRILEETLEERERKISGLESSIQWITNKPLYRFISRLRGIFRLSD